jgi:aminoglycoside phosphotransferase (APT) family kinase protein
MESRGRGIPERLLGFLNAKLTECENLQLSDLTKIGASWETDVLAVGLSYDLKGRRRHEQLVLRLYPGRDGMTKSAKEFRAMRQLFEMGYPVPQVLMLEETGEALGKPFMLMERIDSVKNTEETWRPKR